MEKIILADGKELSILEGASQENITTYVADYAALNELAKRDGKNDGEEETLYFSPLHWSGSILKRWDKHGGIKQDMDSRAGPETVLFLCEIYSGRCRGRMGNGNNYFCVHICRGDAYHLPDPAEQDKVPDGVQAG